jgi:hypothetical protein
MDAELRRRLTDSLKRAVPYGSDGPLLEDLVERSAKLAGSPSLPLPGETAAVTFLNHKTAALCYDRVWAFGPMWVPDGVRFGGTTDVELDTLGRWFTLISVLFCSEDQETIEELGFTAENLEFFQQEKERLMTELIESIGGVRSPEGEVSFLDAHSRALSLELNANHGLKTVPVYGSTDARDLDFKSGDYSVIVATLSNLKVVSETETSWDQIMEFRGDDEARRKYVRLAHWLDGSFDGKSFSYIENEISQRIDDYEWALEKHGLRTVIGCLSEALDPVALSAAAAVAGVGVLGGQPELGHLLGAITLMGRVGLRIASGQLDIEDARRTGGREIAFVHELKCRFGGEPN